MSWLCRRITFGQQRGPAVTFSENSRFIGAPPPCARIHSKTFADEVRPIPIRPVSLANSVQQY